MLFRSRKARVSLLLSSFFIFSSTQSSVLLSVPCFSTDVATFSNVYKITKDPIFGQAVLNTTVTNFNNSSFSCGDSVNIVFSNGKVLVDSSILLRL